VTDFSSVSTLGRWGLVGAALVVLAIMAVTVLGGARDGEATTMTTSDTVKKVAIPALDAAAPAVTETATFALG